MGTRGIALDFVDMVVFAVFCFLGPPRDELDVPRDMMNMVRDRDG